MPAVRPETIPVPEPIRATLVLLLVHVPPLVGLLNSVDWPAHMLAVPVLAAREGDTVATADRTQPMALV